MNEFEMARQYEMRTGAADYLRYAHALMLAKGDQMQAPKIYEKRWPRSKNLELVKKTAVGAGTTTDATWGAPIAQLEHLGNEFISVVRPRTVVGRLTGVRRVPFGVKVPRQTSGASVSWAGQGRVARAGPLAFDSVTLKQAKISGIVVVSSELARMSDPAAEKLIQDDLIGGVAQFTDEQFLDPTIAAVDDVSPASITNNATSIESSGTTTAAVTADLQDLFAAVENPEAPVLIMKPATAAYLCRLSGDGGYAFPGLNLVGPSSLWGVPVIISNNVPADADSPTQNLIILLDATGVLLADGGVELDASEHALVEMNTAPDSPVTAGTTMVSLWQQNLMGIRATRYIRWEKRRDNCCAVLEGVTY